MDSEQFAALVSEADVQLSKLRSLYDQWFSGIERIEPQPQRDAFEKLMKTLQRQCPNNTAARFRHQQLVQRYLTYSTYWQRVARQIEEGTFKRDVVKARKKRSAREDSARSLRKSQDLELDLEMELDMDAILESAAAHAPPPPAPINAGKPPPTPSAKSKNKPAAPPITRAHKQTQRDHPQPTLDGPKSAGENPPAAPRFRQPAAKDAKSKDKSSAARTPAGAHAGQMSEQQLRDIYDRYVAARAKNNERTDNVKIGTIAKNLQGMMPKLTQKHKGKRIDFEVVLRDGKVALKPVAK